MEYVLIVHPEPSWSLKALANPNPFRDGFIPALLPSAQIKPNNTLSKQYYSEGEESQSLLQHL